MSEREAARRSSVACSTVLRYLDVVLVILAMPVALSLSAPAVGIAVAAAAWMVQRMLARSRIKRWIAGRGAAPRFGLNLVDAFGRIWLLAGAIVLAAVIGGRRDGLTAAVQIFCAYSVAFAIRLVSGRPRGRSDERRGSVPARRMRRLPWGMSKGKKICSSRSWTRGSAGSSSSSSCSASSHTRRRPHQRVFSPTDEFKLDTWFQLGPVAFDKGVLYLLITVGITIGVMRTSPGV